MLNLVFVTLSDFMNSWINIVEGEKTYFLLERHIFVTKISFDSNKNNNETLFFV
jgi:hypothetical protein